MALGTQQTPYQTQQQHQQMLPQRLYHQPQHQRVIAPAPSAASATMGTQSTAAASRLYMPYTKPVYDLNGTTLDSNNPSVVRRNARERNRVKQVNNGFVNLRQHIPQAIVADLSNGRRGGTGPSASKKLSKVDTLRMAVEYIRRLKNVIDEVDQSDASSVSSFNSCGSSSASSLSGSLSGSPPPATNAPSSYLDNHHFQLHQQQQLQQQQLYYPGSFQHLPQHQLISPAASISSSTYSEEPCNSSGYFQNAANSTVTESPLKYEQAAYEEYPNNSTEDEELLDYISLWQEDL